MLKTFSEKAIHMHQLDASTYFSKYARLVGHDGPDFGALCCGMEMQKEIVVELCPSNTKRRRGCAVVTEAHINNTYKLLSTMQAYLQYRRIRQAVRRQTELEHDKSARTSPGTIVEESKDQYARPVSPHPAQEDRELQTTTTRHSQRTAIGEALSGIHVRDRTTHEGKAGKVFVVDWDGDQDPLNPRNYSHAYRISITLMVSSIAFAVGAASSIDSAIIPQAAAEFDVSEVAESLCVGT